MTTFLMALMCFSVFIPRSFAVGPILLAIVDFIALPATLFLIIKHMLLRQQLCIPRFWGVLAVFLLGLICSLFTTLNMFNSIKEILQYLQLSLLFTFLIYNVIRSESRIQAMLRGIVFGSAGLGMV
jgi:hypothetical protein